MTIIINTIYLAANVLFINVLKLDILGTALAMNVARVIGGAIAMYALMGIHSPLRVTFSDIFRVQRNVLMSILRVAVPYGVEQVFFTGGNLIVQIYMAVLGTANVASYAIANSSVGLMYAVTTSVGTLAITVCGRSTGANDKVLTRRYGKSMMSLSFVLTFISVLVFTPLMPLTLKLYGAPAENLALIYRLVMIITIPLPFFYPTASVMPNILRSAGDSAYSSMISLITMWVIRVALGYYLGIVQGMGVAGVVCCFGIEWAVKSVFYALRFRGESWLNKKTIEE